MMNECLRCGKCCDIQPDGACEHLVKDGDKYACEIYENRFGYHMTVRGIRFRCGKIAEVKWMGMLPKGCVYE